MNMKYLITGGAGFIGSHFVELQKSKGNDSVVLDGLYTGGHLENLENLAGIGKVDFVKGDIRDGELVSSILQKHKVDYVVHFAAESHVDRSITGPIGFVDTNMLGTAVLLQCAREYWESLGSEKKNTFRFLQVSTDEVFGELGNTGYFTETTPYDPRSPYSASKAGADHLVRAWNHTYGLPTLITNCSNNYGPRQLPEKLIPRMIQCALLEMPLPVYGKGENIRDWIFVKDHCSGIDRALNQAAPGSTYCFGGRAERKNIDLVNGLCAILDEIKPRSNGKKYVELIEFVEDRLGHDWRYAIDDSKAERELGFERSVDFENGLRATVEWYLSNQNWATKVMEKN